MRANSVFLIKTNVAEVSKPCLRPIGMFAIGIVWPVLLLTVVCYVAKAQPIFNPNLVVSGNIGGNVNMVNPIDIPLLEFGTIHSGRPAVVNKYVYRPNSALDDWHYQSTLFYNYDNGLRVMSITEISRRGDSLRRKAFVYHPLSKVLLVEKIQVYSNQLGWQDSIETSHYYDNNQPNILRLKQISNLKVKFNGLPTQTLYCYRPDGRPEYIRQRTEFNFRWVDLSVEYYKYNSTGLELSRSLFEFEDVDSTLTLRTFKTFDIAPALLPDTVYQAVHHWQYENNQNVKLRSDTIYFAPNSAIPTAWTETYFSRTMLVTKRLRYYNVTFSNYIQNNLVSSTLQNQTEQVWRGNQFVDNSRTNYQAFPSNAVSIVREVATNNAFTPAERFQAPIDTFGNKLGNRFERWVNSRRLWVFNKAYTSTVINHSYEPTNARLIESIVSVTDTAGYLNKAYLLEYLNYILDVPLATTTGPQFMVYPNPASHTIRLKVAAYLGNGAQTSYIIRSVAGQLVSQGTLTDLESAIDVSALTNGVYIIGLVGNGAAPVRFLKGL